MPPAHPPTHLISLVLSVQHDSDPRIQELLKEISFHTLRASTAEEGRLRAEKISDDLRLVRPSLPVEFRPSFSQKLECCRHAHGG